mmetsp:Transcript_4188/g.7674  ORF Transcript_4188/g.7674 Transcript_4188/m.7674 type:complete len:312 (-) Transcript_4188:523-1458(-)
MFKVLVGEEHRRRVLILEIIHSLIHLTAKFLNKKLLCVSVLLDCQRLRELSRLRRPGRLPFRQVWLVEIAWEGVYHLRNLGRHIAGDQQVSLVVDHQLRSCGAGDLIAHEFGPLHRPHFHVPCLLLDLHPLCLHKVCLVHCLHSCSDVGLQHRRHRFGLVVVHERHEVMCEHLRHPGWLFGNFRSSCGFLLNSLILWLPLTRLAHDNTIIVLQLGAPLLGRLLVLRQLIARKLRCVALPRRQNNHAFGALRNVSGPGTLAGASRCLLIWFRCKLPGIESHQLGNHLRLPGRHRQPPFLRHRLQFCYLHGLV